MRDPYSPSPAVVIGFDDSRSAIDILLDRLDRAALDAARCSMLISDRQSWL